jgi:transposase-like protein
MILDEPYFRDETAAHAKLEQLVWPSGPVCPHCGALGDAGRMRSWHARTALWFCRRCRKQFRATMGTFFEGSHVPLHKWFQALFLRYATFRSISPHRLSLTLEITNKTALAMVRRIDTSLGFSTWRTRHNRHAPPLACIPEAEKVVPWAPPEPLNMISRQINAFRDEANHLGFNANGTDFEQVLAQIARHRPPRHARRGAAAQPEAAE